MTLENPIFGSHEGHNEATVEKNLETSTSHPAESPASPEADARESGSKKVEMGRTYFTPNTLPEKPVPPKRTIGFSPWVEKREETPAPEPSISRKERSNPIPEFSDSKKETPDLKMKVEEPPAHAPAFVPPAPKAPEKPMFEAPPKPKQTFGELKSESVEDYNDLVNGIKNKVQEVKDKAAALMSATAEKTKVAPVYRGSKATLEKLTKTALLVRSINQYGWWRLGKEATVDAFKRKGEELAKKGLKYILENLTKRQGILDAVSTQLNEQFEPLKKQLAEISAIQKQLEQLQSQGVISGFKIKPREIII